MDSFHRHWRWGGGENHTHEFYVNRASYFIEILKMDCDEPARENELGRIVITDYHNFAQPFVRYDTGDLGRYSYRMLDGARRYVLTEVAGRKSDLVYDCNDLPVSTFAIGCALETFDLIRQYQLVQDSRTDFVLNIIDPERHYSSGDFKRALENFLGRGIDVSVVYPDRIPVLDSGKFKRIICNYKPERPSGKNQNL